MLLSKLSQYIWSKFLVMKLVIKYMHLLHFNITTFQKRLYSFYSSMNCTKISSQQDTGTKRLTETSTALACCVRQHLVAYSCPGMCKLGAQGFPESQHSGRYRCTGNGGQANVAGALPEWLLEAIVSVPPALPNRS